MMNIQGLMKQAQMMQKKMQEEQQRLEQEEFEGVSGGGMVKVVINGKFNMQKINIDKFRKYTRLSDMLFVILCSRRNCKRAIYLFKEHNPEKLMRKCHI